MTELGVTKNTAEIVCYTTEFKYTSLVGNFFWVTPKIVDNGIESNSC